jgi:hypothetical protein
MDTIISGLAAAGLREIRPARAPTEWAGRCVDGHQAGQLGQRVLRDITLAPPARALQGLCKRRKTVPSNTSPPSVPANGDGHPWALLRANQPPCVVFNTQSLHLEPTLSERIPYV